MTGIRKFSARAAAGGFFDGLIELLARVTRTDLTHLLEMREQPSRAWSGGGDVL